MGSPGGLKLSLKFLELRGRRRKSFDLEMLKIAEFFIKSRGVLRVRVN